MNEITLGGYIRNIQYSHSIGDVIYDKAELITKRPDGKEDIIQLRFKKFTNPYQENQYVELVGNLRSYSQNGEDGKNHIIIYVHTYFDLPTMVDEDITNSFTLDGRVCKIEGSRISKNGAKSYQFILANNIITQNGKKLNVYIPMIAWGKTAVALEGQLEVGKKITVFGSLHSRLYKKSLGNDDFEYRTAYEGIVLNYELED